MSTEKKLEELDQDFRDLYDSIKEALNNMSKIVHINTAHLMLIATELGMKKKRHIALKEQAIKMAEMFQTMERKDKEETNLSAGIAENKEGIKCVYISIDGQKIKLCKSDFEDFQIALNECAKEAFEEEVKSNELH